MSDNPDTRVDRSTYDHLRAENDALRLKAEVARLKAENEKLKQDASPSRQFSLKVSEKGGVSAYGLGRFPVTLYREQWTGLLENEAEIRAFIRDNAALLKRKS